MCDIFYLEDVHEDLLYALPLATNTTGAELSSHQMAILYIRKIKRSICVGICTDGAAAMTGRLSGLTAQIKEVAPESKSTHSVIHRKMLASRKITPEFNSVSIDVLKLLPT